MEFDASVLVGKLPFDGNWICVFLLKVGNHFPTHFAGRFDPSAQASPHQKSNFDLSHIEPTSMARGVEELKTLAKRTGFLGKRPS